MINWAFLRQLLHPPPWLLYTWIVVVGEGILGKAFGCVVRAPPGFECDAAYALPMPIGTGWPIRVVLGYFLPAGLLFLVVQSVSEALDETAKASLDRFFGRIVHADPYSLLGTVDQRGLHPPGWLAPADGFDLQPFDEAELHRHAERAFVLVQQAWAQQDPMLARTVVAVRTWQVFNERIDDSRRFRRGGILLAGLKLAGGRLLRTGYLGAEPAAAVRLQVRCSDPLTDCEQDWTFVRPRDEPWLVVAVDPVKPESRPSGPDGRLERT